MRVLAFDSLVFCGWADGLWCAVSEVKGYGTDWVLGCWVLLCDFCVTLKLCLYMLLLSVLAVWVMTTDTLLSPKPGYRIGYARVSTHEQSLDLQLDALRQAGCARVYQDKVSGTQSARPGLDQLKEVLRPEDILVVWRLDRLGRSLRDLIDWNQWLMATEVELVSLRERIDTATSAGKLTFHLFAALAEFERDCLVERTLAGRAAARARGRLGGRKHKLSSEQVAQLKTLRNDKDLSVDGICATFGISRRTFYRYWNNG